MSAVPRVAGWLASGLAQPIVRLEIIRILAPLAVLGFMSGRLAHATEWLGSAGFRVPDIGGDWRQPVYIPPLPDAACWAVAAVMILAGLAVSAGWRARPAAFVFAVTLAFVALTDRLAAFTVSKIAPVLMLALALSPCGSQFGIDARRRRRRDPSWVPPDVALGGLLFFQVWLCVFYSASGIAKLRGDWLSTPFVLWTHLHDSYQTAFSHWLANSLPVFAWPLLQGGALLFELGAPVWFALRRTRGMAFLVGMAMHALIGLMFGPVKWFALLMMSLLIGCFLPDRFLGPIRPRGRV